MRNWNSRRYTVSLSEVLLPDYLWGIETLSEIEVWTSLDSASRLPMRNWNQCQELERSQKYRFQTTYEELKHRKREMSKEKIPLASRLPMRNWNRSSRWFWPLTSFGFQTTYEELKLWIMLLIYAGKTLPLPDYLWGIETTKTPARRPLHESASRLPMRNWNLPFLRFQTPW